MQEQLQTQQDFGYYDINDKIGSWFRAAKGVLLRPTAFFEGMPDATDYAPMIWYYTITMAPGLLLTLLFSLPVGIVAVPVAWALGLAALWLWGWYFAWAVRTFCKQQLDTRTAFALAVYANTPNVLFFVPVLNALISIWTLVLDGVGLVKKAKASAGAAALIVIVPLIVLALSFWILFALVFGGMMAAMQLQGF